MHHLSSDEQLTILKVGPSPELNTSLEDNGSNSLETPKNSTEIMNATETKVDYIVLHKLPNGEALDLEHMQTYTMEDLDSEINNVNGLNENLTTSTRRPTTPASIFVKKDPEFQNDNHIHETLEDIGLCHSPFEGRRPRPNVHHHSRSIHGNTRTD